MNIKITPTLLAGDVIAPSSKSIGHRELICAALAEGESTVDNITASEDIEATCRILTELGAVIAEEPSVYKGRSCFRVKGGLTAADRPLTADCGESGSTLRFAIPLGLLSGNEVTYIGRGKLTERPLTPYYNLFTAKKINYQSATGGLPLTVKGQLTAGAFELPGDVSSQFFTGLLQTLPLLEGDSTVRSTTKLESASYIRLTLECMARHGVQVQEKSPGVYIIPGGQQYRAGRYTTEGDYSQAAFWLTAGVLGKGLTCSGLSLTSAQGDRIITTLLQNMGAQVTQIEESVTTTPARPAGTVIDVEDCPDLVPILAVAAALGEGTTEIINGARVRLKECDRLQAMARELTALGADVTESEDGLVIKGKEKLTGGTVSSWNDHRIAMALAIASQRCTEPLIIEGAECVNKSYPGFWQDFVSVGGVIEEI